MTDSLATRSETTDASPWLDQVRWDAQGLVTAIAQDAQSQRVLMVAWMNREALSPTAQDGRAAYWSRTRRRLWPMLEDSGPAKTVLAVRLACDGEDTVILRSQVVGYSFHTQRDT